MDINVFLTQKAAQSGSKNPAAPQAVLNGNGIFSGIAGANFMDLIFARLTGDAKPVSSDKKEEAPLSQNNSLLTKTELSDAATNGAASVMTVDPLAPLPDGTGEIALSPKTLELPQGTEISAVPDIAGAPVTPQAPILASGESNEILPLPAQVENFEGTLNVPSISVPEQAQFLAVKNFMPSQTAHGGKKFAAFLESLLQGVPQDGTPVAIALNPGKIKNLIAQAQGEKDLPSSALIATGLTPEKLTEILQEIADGDDQSAAFVIGFVKILPEESRKDAVFLPRGIVVLPKQPATGEAAPSQPESGADEGGLATASKLNALTVGGEDLPAEGNDFEDILKIFEQAQETGGKTGPQNSANGIETAARPAKLTTGTGSVPVAATVPGTPPLPEELSASFSSGAVYPEGWDFATGSAHSLNVTGPAQLTSMISHIQQAGLPHPATQMVASVIAKNAASGENRNITIQLDPPDLGKVAVSMEFHKDGNKMKAVLIAEKPETFLMLQRDSHVLERALQDAGINADGGLSFELSQDGGAFSHDHHSTGGNSGGGAAGNEGEAEMEITETRMDWYVDPQTGRTRYDALV